MVKLPTTNFLGIVWTKNPGKTRDEVPLKEHYYGRVLQILGQDLLNDFTHTQNTSAKLRGSSYKKLIFSRERNRC